MYKKYSYLSVIFILIALLFFGFTKRAERDNQINKVNQNDVYKYIAINQVLMWVSNNGDGSHDPRTDGSGFYWPGGENAVITAIFEDGFIVGGKVGREVRVNGSVYRHGLQAGKILDDGTPDDPSLSKYKIYKIRKGWELLPPGSLRDELEDDYNNWPVEDGAPWVDVDGDGVFTRGVDQPHFIGDEVLWWVNNDMDPARSTFTYGTLPMGIEFQTTVFGFNRTGDLGDMVFKIYKFMNKGTITVRDMVVAYWSDTDLGFAGDDFTGCDTLLSLGYTYNGDDNDENFYGSPCPAVGYDFFQGPKVEYDPNDPVVQRFNLPDSAKFDGRWIHGYTNYPMTAFTLYINGSAVYRDPSQGVAEGSVEFYNYMTGKVWNGSPFIDPNTGEEVDFTVAGDPVAGTGWYEGQGWPGGPQPDDRRHVMASGKFTFSPGDTQEVTVGLLIGVGSTTLLSVDELKRKDLAAQIAYDLDFNLTPAPQAPILHANTNDRVITLWWEDNAEDYDELDPLITGKGYDDTTYTFQGYQLWQFSDLAGSDPILIGTWDVIDTISTVWGYTVVNGENVLVPKIAGSNEGLRRNITIVQDMINNRKLRNGNPYYFAVTAYGVSPYSSPSYLESSPVIMEIFPGRDKIDVTSDYEQDQNIYATQVAGVGSGKVKFNLVDPLSLTGHKYRVQIYGSDDAGDKSYSLFDETTQDTLLWQETTFVHYVADDFGNMIIPKNDTLGQKVVDGFQLLVSDLYTDSTTLGHNKYFVNTVEEINGPGGTPVDPPVNVWDHPSDNGGWYVTAKGEVKSFVWQKTQAFEGLGFNDYEIRFDGTSQFYASGTALSFFPLLAADPVGIGTVPFTVWDLGQTPDDPSDDQRLLIKVLDFAKDGEGNNIPERAKPDSMFSHLENGNWEEIYVFHTDLNQDDPLPDPSPRLQAKESPFGAFVFNGDLPADGTVIRINSVKPLVDGDAWEATLNAPNLNDLNAAKNKVDEISVFPNPYFGANSLERNKYVRFMRFTGLPTKATIRIFSLSGVYITRIDKNDQTQYADWNLQNKDNLPVGSGMYIAYIDLPGVGTKVLKLAVVLEQQYIDRL